MWDWLEDPEFLDLNGLLGEDAYDDGLSAMLGTGSLFTAPYMDSPGLAGVDLSVLSDGAGGLDMAEPSGFDLDTLFGSAAQPPVSWGGSDRVSSELAGLGGDLPAFTPQAPTGALDTLGQKAGELGDWIGKNPGKALQLGMGGLGLGSVIGGLVKGTTKAPMPNRANVRLTPQEQAAANQLAATRQQVSGTPDARGYAGEMALREQVNDQLQAALSGNLDLVSPLTARKIEDQRRQLQDRLRLELGPAFATSTAGTNALRNFEEYANEVLSSERDKKLALLNQMGTGYTNLYHGLEMDPAQIAQLELSTLAPIANQQAALTGQIGAANAAQDNANTRALLGVGGQLGGIALSPYLYELFKKKG